MGTCVSKAKASKDPTRQAKTMTSSPPVPTPSPTFQGECRRTYSDKGYVHDLFAIGNRIVVSRKADSIEVRTNIKSNGESKCLKVPRDPMHSRPMAGLSGNNMVSTTADNLLCVWVSPFKFPRECRVQQGAQVHKSLVTGFAELTDHRIVSRSKDCLAVWTLGSDHAPVLQFQWANDLKITTMNPLPSNRLLTRVRDDVLGIWDLSDHDNPPLMAECCISTTRSGAGGDQEDEENKDGQELNMLPTQAGLLCTTALPNNRVATGHTDGRIQIWDLECHLPLIQVFRAHSKTVDFLDVMADGHLLSASTDGSMCTWDTENRFAPVHSICEIGDWSKSSGIHAVAALGEGGLAVAHAKGISVWM